MATATSTRSPSPTPRNPDFVFSNKPEFQYRTGFGSRRSRRATFEQKENAIIPNRMRSPSPSGKGTRNFMAPTISASSKIIASSPKRKILVDKNEILRSSVDSVRSSVDSVDFTKPLMDFSSYVPKDSFQNGEETKNVDPSTLPPYDPDTNYLSPRPQFLHYRPSMRVEQYLDNEGDGKRLEDDFLSEGSEETAEVVEEERSSELRKSCGDETEESEVVVSGDENLAVECETVGNSVGKRWKLVSILAILVTACVFGLLTSPLISESSVLRSRVKHWFVQYSTAVKNEELGSLILTNLSASMIGQTDTIGYGYAEGLHEQTNEDIEMKKSVKEESFVDSESFLKSELPVEVVEIEHNEVEEPVKEESFADNKSSLELELPVEVLEIEQNEVEVTEELRDVADADLVEESLAKTESFLELELPDEGLEVGRNEAVAIEDFGDVFHVVLDGEKSEIGLPLGSFEGDRVLEKVDEHDDAAEIIQDETLRGSGSQSHADISPDLASGTITEPKIVEVPEEISNVNSGEEAQLSDNGNSLPQPDGHGGSSVGGDLGSAEFVYHDLGRKSSSAVILGTTIAVLLLTAAAYLVYRFVNKRRASTVNTTVAEGAAEAQEKEAMSMSISGSSESYVLRRGSHLVNTPAVRMANFGSPSEFMSTLQHSSSVGQGKKISSDDIEEDSFSQERDTRRDSTVSSVSYGSFTTYEKLSAKKKGLNEDEGLAPVRRSSRIRNKATSGMS